MEGCAHRNLKTAYCPNCGKLVNVPNGPAGLLHHAETTVTKIETEMANRAEWLASHGDADPRAIDHAKTRQATDIERLRRWKAWHAWIEKALEREQAGAPTP